MNNKTNKQIDVEEKMQWMGQHFLKHSFQLSMFKAPCDIFVGQFLKKTKEWLKMLKLLTR